MKIGFSLSWCIREICEGAVKIEDVHHIVTGCSPESEQDVEQIIAGYSKNNWYRYPDEAKKIFNQLRANNKIMWCSHFDKNPVNIGSFHWLDCP